MEGRLVENETRELNVAFRLPYDEVVQMWHYSIAEGYRAEVLYDRFAYNLERTYPNRTAAKRAARVASEHQPRHP